MNFALNDLCTGVFVYHSFLHGFGIFVFRLYKMTSCIGQDIGNILEGGLHACHGKVGFVISVRETGNSRAESNHHTHPGRQSKLCWILRGNQSICEPFVDFFSLKIFPISGGLQRKH